MILSVFAEGLACEADEAGEAEVVGFDGGACVGEVGAGAEGERFGGLLAKIAAFGAVGLEGDCVGAKG